LAAGANGGDTLVDSAPGQPVNRGTIFPPDWDSALLAEANQLLNAAPSEPAGDQHAFERPPGAERFHYWMETDQNR
jgi:hypothetical protein